MSIRELSVGLVVLVAVVAGCDGKRYVENPGANGPFGKVKLGMMQGEAVEAAPGIGFGRGYDQLPIKPGPRQRYPKIPPRSTWMLWQGEEKDPILILGFWDGKVIYKEVIERKNGQLTSESNAAKEYQGTE